MQQLISKLIVPAFHNPLLGTSHDSAVFECPSRKLAFTTDSFVVRPMFFPGGDVGSLSVHGTVNDLAMSGARPAFLSASFIIEEGLPMEALWRVVSSMEQAARACDVQIVTGDTKVVERGKGDALFINTAGIGFIEHTLDIRPASVRAGDAVLLNGDIGRHGIAIMAVREGLQFETTIESDSAPLAQPVLDLLEAGIDLHCLRDITRGGLTAVANEIAEVARVGITLDEGAIPIQPDVAAACELLGLDPLQVACEGRFIAFVPSHQAEQALEVMSRSGAAARIGSVAFGEPRVILRTSLGRRILSVPAGEQLPRIC